MSHNPQNKPSIGEIERRSFRVESRASQTDSERRIGGSASLAGNYYDMGWYLEIIEPGAFNEADTSQCACLFNHERSRVLGRTKSGTLTLTVSDNSLDYDNIMPDTSDGRDVYTLVERGDIDTSSFAFIIAKEAWRYMDRSELEGKVDPDALNRATWGGKVEVRVIEKISDILDVAPVTFAANPDTTVAKRHAEESRQRQRPEAPTPDNEQVIAQARARVAVLHLRA